MEREAARSESQAVRAARPGRTTAQAARRRGL